MSDSLYFFTFDVTDIVLAFLSQEAKPSSVLFFALVNELVDNPHASFPFEETLVTLKASTAVPLLLLLNASKFAKSPSKPKPDAVEFLFFFKSVTDKPNGSKVSPLLLFTLLLPKSLLAKGSNADSVLLLLKSDFPNASNGELFLSVFPNASNVGVLFASGLPNGSNGDDVFSGLPKGSNADAVPCPNESCPNVSLSKNSSSFSKLV